MPVTLEIPRVLEALGARNGDEEQKQISRYITGSHKYCH